MRSRELCVWCECEVSVNAHCCAEMPVLSTEVRPYLEPFCGTCGTYTRLMTALMSVEYAMLPSSEAPETQLRVKHLLTLSEANLRKVKNIGKTSTDILKRWFATSALHFNKYDSDADREFYEGFTDMLATQASGGEK